MKTTTRLLSAFALLATGACGSTVGHIHEDVAKEVVAQDAEGALAQYRLVVGDFEPRSSAAECVSLRAKVTGHRDQVRVGSEWLSIKETAAFKALDGAEKEFRKAHCVAGDPQPSEMCGVLADQLNEQAGALAKTPQWQTLENNSHWHELLGDVRKAQQIQCL